METWYQVAVLSVGGVLGVNARYWLGVVINRWTGPQFPWATLTINVTGSFAIGLFTVALARWLPHPLARLLVAVGFLGGYTTFSSFSFESLALWERGERGLCLTYMVASVAAGFAAVVLGTALGRGLTVPAAERATRGDRTAVDSDGRVWTAPGRDRAAPPTLADDPGPPPTRPGPRESVSAADEPGASS